MEPPTSSVPEGSFTQDTVDDSVCLKAERDKERQESFLEQFQRRYLQTPRQSLG